MVFQAGKLRHRVVIQKPVETQETDMGAMDVVWQNVATVWASIEPISVREFIAAQVETSKVTTRIVIRYRPDVTAKMRLYHAAKDAYYNIEGILSDKNSGLEYMTLPCSEGVRYQDGDSVLAVNLELPEISGIPDVGEILTGSQGVWANDPTSYIYQWYVDDVAVPGEDGIIFIVPDDVGESITFGVIAVTTAGNSIEAVSDGVEISS